MNGTQYYYLYNAQGDVMAITDFCADIVAKYNYDAWGKVISVTNASGVVQTSASFIGNVNPIRYRGYYYDKETGLYYLQSRYYDPETGRFINADAINIDTDQGNVYINNLFAYCYDDPVNNIDPIGYLVGVDDVAILIIVGIIMTTTAVIAMQTEKTNYSPMDLTAELKNSFFL